MVQLGGFGAITPVTNIILEIVVESARILLFLYVIGLANIETGVRRIKRSFTDKGQQKIQWAIAVKNFKKRRSAILVNIVAFLLIVWMVNYLIDLVAYETCLYLTLKKGNVLAQSSSEWTIILFFKNISVIPFTLMFETLLVLWLFNKISYYRAPNLVQQ